MATTESPSDAGYEVADDPLERALRRHNESLVISRLPEGVQPAGLDLASIEAIVLFVKTIVDLSAAGVGLYLGADRIVQVRQKRKEGDEPVALPPDLDEIAERLKAGEVTPQEALARLPEWLRPGSPAHRQALELAIDGDQLLDQLCGRGLPSRIAKQIVNEVKRSL